MLTPSHKLREAEELLGLGKQPSKDEIIQAFKTHVKEQHPDGGGSSDAFSELMAARNLLLQHLVNEPCGACRGTGRKRAAAKSFSAQTTKCKSCDGTGVR